MSVHCDIGDDRHTHSYMANETIFLLDRRTGVCTRRSQLYDRSREMFEPMLFGAFAANEIVSTATVFYAPGH